MASTLARSAANALRTAEFTADHAANTMAGESVLMVETDRYAEAVAILAGEGLALSPLDFSDGESTYLTAATITRA